MNAKSILLFAACASISAAPRIGQAHFLWVSLNPATKSVAVGLQEVPGQYPLPLGARASKVRGWLPTGRSLGLKSDNNWIRANTVFGCVGASLDYGVIDRQDAGRGVFWLKYYAKGAATPAASQVNLHLPVELSAKVSSDGKAVITVFQNGKPAANADLVVEDGSGKATFEGTSGPDGTATLPASAGPIEVRALITDNTPGTHGGLSYNLTRSYSTLTVADPSAKPLTRMLRGAFGNMHDVVSNTAFINTVMAGTLTKAQLVDHFAQRALINEAVDKILRSSHVAPLPYDRPQRDVLKLLRADLARLGAPWPTISQAWPLTQSLLAEIDESAKKGPYFALGVFHVYYGGITHGGRDIGKMIDDQLKTNSTYYLKSDGYDPYAVAVDEITDPDAQQEMIRGGVDAYHYIIAVNNLDTFKSAKGSSGRILADVCLPR